MPVHVKKNDQVKVLAGKDRGKIGKVLKVFPDKGKVIIEGINFYKKHTRANPRQGIQAGITQKEAPMAASNVMIVCPECGKQTRVKHKVLEDGTKQRLCAKCNGSLDK